MVDQLPEHAAKILNTVSLDYLERLVRGIDHKQITKMVKHSKYLQKNVFPGFRPTNLPWERVPVRLAQDAHRHPDARATLLMAWLETNSTFCEEIKQTIRMDTIEEDVVNLLVRLGSDEIDRLLWALLLDEREEILSTLANGLQDALANETSALMVRANQIRLAGQLEKAHQEIRSLKEQRNKLENRDRLLSREIEQYGDLQNELKTLKKAKNDEEEQYRDKVRQLEAALQKTIEEKDTAQQKVRELQETLDQEKIHATELQKRIDNLETSLDYEFGQMRQVLATRDEAQNPLFPLLEIDESWNEAIETLADHLSLFLPVPEPTNPSVPSREKVDDWQTWQQAESTSIRPLLATNSISIEDLVNVARVQKLLVLRWYLLECLKLSLTETLSADNRIH